MVLSAPANEAIEDRPAPIYAPRYAWVSALLDETALGGSRYKEKRGAQAMPLTASQVLAVANNHSFLSHKAVAVAAGIGWQGKSLLTISPECGPRPRLVTIPTGVDRTPDNPDKNRCGSGTTCTDACPAGTIRNVRTDSHYASRDEALRSAEHRVREVNAKMEHIGSSIYGLCLRGCPRSKKSEFRRPGRRRGGEPRYESQPPNRATQS